MIHNKVIGQLLGRLAQPQEHGKMVEERTIDASKVMEADGLEEAESLLPSRIIIGVSEFSGSKCSPDIHI
jgi:hypothetical protein